MIYISLYWCPIFVNGAEINWSCLSMNGWAAFIRLKGNVIKKRTLSQWNMLRQMGFYAQCALSAHYHTTAACIISHQWYHSTSKTAWTLCLDPVRHRRREIELKQQNKNCPYIQMFLQQRQSEHLYICITLSKAICNIYTLREWGVLHGIVTRVGYIPWKCFAISL